MSATGYMMTGGFMNDNGGVKMEQVRLLRQDEIECRVGTINEKGLSLLLYKDARADMKILDETYGPMNWKRTHKMVGESLYCIVSVWDDTKQQWITKMDVGTESYTEKEKGRASPTVGTAVSRHCPSLTERSRQSSTGPCRRSRTVLEVRLRSQMSKQSCWRQNLSVPGSRWKQ